MQNTYETNKNNELNFAKFCMLSEKKSNYTVLCPF